MRSRTLHDLALHIDHDQLDRVTRRTSPNHLRRNPLDLGEYLRHSGVFTYDRGVTRPCPSMRLHNAVSGQRGERALRILDEAKVARDMPLESARTRQR
jgi:hypothetical protein